VLAAPLVRKVARDLGVPLEAVSGSGPQGRVRLEDVRAFAEARGADGRPATGRAPTPGARPEPPPGGLPLQAQPTDRRVPFSGLRKRIAEHMLTAARSAPHVWSMDLLDVSELVQTRETLLPQADREGVHLTYLPFIVKAVIEALRAVPFANALVDEARGEIVLKGSYHIGIATAVPDGLVVPVIHHADQLSLIEVARELAELVERARARRSSAADLADGTFTITSYGNMPGAPLFATPILNHPQVAILGIGRVEPQPRVVDGQVVPRPCLGVSFGFDHRVMDGEGAGAFLLELKRYLEHPLQLLLRLR
jgi:pyruvate dehydrogenase E2 component (dihydrolipoamide acetyltransferase)